MAARAGAVFGDAEGDVGSRANNIQRCNQCLRILRSMAASPERVWRNALGSSKT